MAWHAVSQGYWSESYWALLIVVLVCLMLDFFVGAMVKFPNLLNTVKEVVQ
jgi:hypothetical protein